MSSATTPIRTVQEDSPRWVDVSPWVASAAVTEQSAPSWYVKYRRLLLAGDTAAVSLAILASFGLLFTVGQPLKGAEFLNYGWLALLLTPAWVITLGAIGTREREMIGSGLQEYRRVIVASLALFGGLAILSYLFESSPSRALFVSTLPLGICLLVLERWSLRKLLHRLRRRGRALTPTLVAGNAEAVADVVAQLHRDLSIGYQPAAMHLTDGSRRTTSTGPAIRCLDTAGFEHALERGRYGAVILTEGLDRAQIRQIAWRLENRPIQMMFVPRLVDVAGPRMQIRATDGLSFVHVDLPRFSGAKMAMKRAFDIVFSVFALLLLLPVFFVVGVLIKQDDGGPIFFRQQRVGRHGEPFTIHKFRTMCTDAEAKIDALIEANGGAALLFKLEDDPRITPIGKFLRKYSLDELPQFWSVLRGGMSVVGPRPQVAREVAEYSDIHHRRLLIKPGITGLWQVNGRSELSMEESIRLDLRYVENWSLIGDIMIVLKTVGVVIRPGAAW
ncbi:MAG: sugar transferase [Micropruina sp.]|uniref:sugar transferase n=1 Tax=Micropruina sp. TaxID=2737536 RepID=UPI0039E3BE13